MKRTVLVTGASSGIGLQTALELARVGFDVVGTARSEKKAESLRVAAAEGGVAVRTQVLDITDRQACHRLIDGLELYGLVNNAGYMNVGAVEDVPPAAALRQLEALVLAPMHLAALAVPGMRRRAVGRIVNVSSVAAHVSGPLIGWYAASKHALDAVSDALRAETAPFGIYVIQIEPGSFQTAIWKKAADDLIARREGSLHAETYDRIVENMPSFEAKAPHPIKVARTVADALTTGKPEHRYLVGADAPLLVFGNFITPPHARDRMRSALFRGARWLPKRQAAS